MLCGYKIYINIVLQYKPTLYLNSGSVPTHWSIRSYHKDRAGTKHMIEPGATIFNMQNIYKQTT